MKVRGKNVLLTGASRGIGVYIARALAEAGANLALVARDADGLRRVVEELAPLGGRVVALPADLADYDSFPGLVERAAQALGSVDVLVNNAALDAQGDFVVFPRKTIEDLVGIDLVAPMMLTQAVLPRMLAARSGQVVSVASLAGKTPTAFNAVYSAAKAGLIGFSHSLRAELDGTGVGISVVSPGFVTEAGMFANKVAQRAGLRVSSLIGTSTPTQVAKGVLRAIESNPADLVVNPGPMRFVLALHQLAPSLMPAMVKRLGMNSVFAVAKELDRERLLADGNAGAQAAKGTDLSHRQASQPR